MRTRRLLACVFPFAVAAGCGVEVVGIDAPDASRTHTTPPSMLDGSAMLDGSVTQDGSAGQDGAPSIDGGTDAPPDAACMPTIIDDPLTTFDAARWRKVSNDPAYPTFEVPPTQTVSMLTLLDMQQTRRSGLWLRQSVPTRAFDVTFKYLVICPQVGQCAHGLGVSWINTTSPAALLVSDTGEGLGMPKSPGGSVTITLNKDFQGNNTITPVTQRIHSVLSGPPGTVSDVTQSDTLVRALRTVTLKLRNGTLSVTNVGVDTVTSSGSVTSNFTGLFGFHAGTSTDTGGFYVGSFRGEFYACDPPL